MSGAARARRPTVARRVLRETALRRDGIGILLRKGQEVLPLGAYATPLPVGVSINPQQRLDLRAFPRGRCGMPGPPAGAGNRAVLDLGIPATEITAEDLGLPWLGPLYIGLPPE
jgi:hypothetical protein